ncbi:hypothetical protein FRC03_008824 [Tulasnella sp. 419]|nr:hypothetical protein FRC03_008824 [Tulasnella sp. 419]
MKLTLVVATTLAVLPIASALHLPRATTTTTKTSSTKTSSTKTSTTKTSTTKTSTTKTSTTKTSTVATFTSVPSGITTAIPASAGYTALATASIIPSGGVFDGHFVKYDRAGSPGDCQGQAETGEAEAVFILEPGATIRNVIIGPAQAEGIHCRGPCTVENVWWEDVCEDAITIKQTGANDVSSITGGGAFGAQDKIVQHNGAGNVTIQNFFAANFGKLYRSCGNCSTSYERHVVVKNVALTGGSAGVGINSNFGDKATLSDVCITTKPTFNNLCCWYEGTVPGEEPEKLGCGPNGLICNYQASDVKTC